jgi:hypothetical protein
LNIRRHVLRLLAGSRKDTGARIYPDFIFFETANRPTWWTDDIAAPEWGEVLGVHEKVRNKKVGSIVVTDNGLALLQDKESTWVRFDEIERWDELLKEPLSTTLRIWTKAGKKIELPFNDAGAFTFVRFLSRAMWEWEHPDKVVRSPG